jgi:uncharacterized protein (TIGR00661 family)
MSVKPLHILISPLDWGLGHASRCIPVISQLIQAGHNVTIAGYGRSAILLKKEFPSLESIEFQGFSPFFSKSGNMLFHLFMLLPQFIGTLFREHSKLKSLITHNHFDLIISDNRYGLWNTNLKSILITHQVMIKTPAWLKFAEYPLYLFSRFLISRFDECWIPDYAETPGLSGDLSHKYPLPRNARFIGPLSRFDQSESTLKENKSEGVITAIISGPEPQRSIFENIVITQLSTLNLSGIIVSGKPESEKNEASNSNLKILPHLNTVEMKALIHFSSIVICRSGYSTIMDLQAMGAKALFVPTPGQTEQIYLAELHEKAGAVLWRNQESLNLKNDIEVALEYNGFEKNVFKSNLASVIKDLKKK